MSETAGNVVWFELPAEDTARARRLYGELFGWSSRLSTAQSSTT